MISEEINLNGRICPYPVFEIVKEVNKMRSGETRTFCVDDPLAIKSVPEELSDYVDIKVNIKNRKKGWKIIVSKEAKND